MRKLLLSIVVLLFALAAQAQDLPKGMKELFGPKRRSCDGPGGAKTASMINFAGIGLQAGNAMDAFSEFTQYRVLDMVTTPDAFGQIDLTNYTSDYKAGLSGNMYGLYVSLRPFNPNTRLINSNHELRIGINYLSNRQLTLRYANGEDWVDYHLTERETNLSLAYLIGGGSDNLKFYAGPFINGGKVGNGNIYAQSSSNAFPVVLSSTKKASMLRGGAQIGASFNIIPQFAITLDGQIGMGRRSANGDETPKIRYTRSIALGIRVDLY